MEIKSRIFTQAINEDEEMLPFVAISDDEEPSKNENFGDVTSEIFEDCKAAFDLSKIDYQPYCGQR